MLVVGSWSNCWIQRQSCKLRETKLPILVLDTSVIFDLERSGLLETTFKLDEPFVTPDLLYRNELESDIGPYLRGLGLQVVELASQEVVEAQGLVRGNRKISSSDAWAWQCAMRENHRLITGDGMLRKLAEAADVPCGGLLWVLDQLDANTLATATALREGLERACRHPRSRLPKDEVELRFTRWRTAEAKIRKADKIRK